VYQERSDRALSVSEVSDEGEQMSTLVEAGAIKVLVRGGDPVSEAGLGSQLQYHHDLEVLPSDAVLAPDVVVLATDLVDQDTTRTIRSIVREEGARVVLVSSTMDGSCSRLATRPAVRRSRQVFGSAA
jgi:hypothetical protein